MIPKCYRRITPLFAPSKQRWTVAKLRDELALELGLDTPEQKANFRIRKQIMNGTEVKLSTTRTLKEEALFNDVKLFLVEGVAPAVGVLLCCPRCHRHRRPRHHLCSRPRPISHPRPQSACNPNPRSHPPIVSYRTNCYLGG